MNLKIKTIGIITLILAVLFSTTVFAANEGVTLEEVKDDVCDIKLGEDGEVIKKLISVDDPKKEVILQIDIKNLKSEEEQIKPSEIFLVLDNSKSMIDNKIDDTTTRKDAVFTAAKTLAEKILANQPSTKIGVVTFSTTSDLDKEGTLEDAKLVKLPTSDLTEIKTAIDSVEAKGYRTDIDAGLQIARENFSTDSNLNKYVILLTDGIPNTVVGGPVNQYSGEVRTKTKATLQSIVDKGINVITVMTGVDSTYMPDPDGRVCSEAAGKTYKDLAEEVFGTQQAPNYGKFFYVTDVKATDTIVTDVYNNLITYNKNEIKNITLVDYFPDLIIANYDFEILEKANIGEVTPIVNTENNSITWKIETLKAGETASFKYKLTLKEKFDEKIINVETPTNEKVDVTYTDTNGDEKKETSDVSPSIILKKTEQPEEPKKEEPKNDNTQAPNPIPQTGDVTIFSILASIGIITAMGIYTFKYINNK